jgi:hypothetical protein
VSLRAGFLAVVVGLLAAVGLFGWSEMRAGRLGAGLLFAGTPMTPTPTRAVGIAGPSSPIATSSREPTRVATPTAEPTRATTTTASAEPTRAPTATRVVTLPTAASVGPREVGLTLEELDSAFKSALEGSGAPLRNPSLQLVPPDRVGLRAAVPVAIFQVPVEMEARLSVDDRGQVKVTTTKVQAVGASLPESVTAELGRRIDDEGGRAISAALPRGAVARRVVVEAERVRVELAP